MLDRASLRNAQEAGKTRALNEMREVINNRQRSGPPRGTKPPGRNTIRKKSTRPATTYPSSSP